MEIGARHVFRWSAGFVDHCVKFWSPIHLCSVIQLGLKVTPTPLSYIIIINDVLATDYDQVRYSRRQYFTWTWDNISQVLIPFTAVSISLQLFQLLIIWLWCGKRSEAILRPWQKAWSGLLAGLILPAVMRASHFVYFPVRWAMRRLKARA